MGPNAERRLGNNAESMRKKPRSVWGPLELLVSGISDLEPRERFLGPWTW